MRTIKSVWAVVCRLLLAAKQAMIREQGRWIAIDLPW
jgi:hypothetical protein